ncbi:MAG: aminopeptidase [Gammaproteobacteria bacterium]|nr:aminopeptidase [Gammaproteobacteria bacterium]MDP2141682.1 aminopeptidase [Gammaproteobacteria bacterium]MDP2347917.1 aminopeptidase [Gammaproteobacteria bacterium]
MRRFLLSIVFAFAVIALLSSCETVGYYGQAAQGQISLLLERRQIDRLLAQEDLDVNTRRKLELILNARRFAEDTLLLPAGNSYLSYVELQRPFVIWNVFAATEFSTTPVSWCYPIAGCVSYRGFFSEARAQRFAMDLQSDGLEVYSGGVDAYSTLGWFADPVTSSVLRRADHRLVALLFHELSHSLIYLPGDTTFNESFATFVEQEGLRRWLQEFPQDGIAAQILAEESMQKQFVALVSGYRDRFAELYASGMAEDLMRHQKEFLRQSLRDDYASLRGVWNYTGYDRWFEGPLNNAQLSTVASYNDLVPGFAALLEEAGGDLALFYARVRELTSLPKTERDALLATDAGTNALQSGFQES